MSIEPPDRCLCGRGPVIGVVAYTSGRMWFFPLGGRQAGWPEFAADFRCVDCVADTAVGLADGRIAAELRAETRDVT